MRNRRSRDANDGHYDTITIWLHWTTVGLNAALWVIGQTADWAPRGSLRTGLWSVHVVLGLATGFALLMRIAWRAHFGRALPPADTGILSDCKGDALYALRSAWRGGRVGHHRRVLPRLQSVWPVVPATVRDRRRGDSAQHQWMARTRGQLDYSRRPPPCHGGSHAPVCVA